MGELYRDPWQEYKSALDSLKKKFLKKPNYRQALAEFGALSLRFQYGFQCVGKQENKTHHFIGMGAVLPRFLFSSLNITTAGHTWHDFLVQRSCYF